MDGNQASPFKEAVFLKFFHASDDQTGRPLWIIDKCDRREWFRIAKRNGKFVRHFHEGNELLVWVEYFSEFDRLPSEDESFQLIVRLYSGEGMNIDFRVR